jgi:hypothetical protein
MLICCVQVQVLVILMETYLLGRTLENWVIGGGLCIARARWGRQASDKIIKYRTVI